VSSVRACLRHHDAKLVMDRLQDYRAPRDCLHRLTEHREVFRVRNLLVVASCVLLAGLVILTSRYFHPHGWDGGSDRRHCFTWITLKNESIWWTESRGTADLDSLGADEDQRREPSRDAWGAEIVVEANRNRLVLRSAGPDGIMETGDDLVWPSGAADRDSQTSCGITLEDES